MTTHIAHNAVTKKPGESQSHVVSPQGGATKSTGGNL